MLSRLHCDLRPTLKWVVALLLSAALVMPVQAEDLQSFAARVLEWPRPEAELEDTPEAGTLADEPEERIETDRNSFTFAPVTPGRGRLIVESSFSYLNIGQEGSSYSFPETVFRYGVGDRLELRLGYNYEVGRASEVAEGEISSNFGVNAEQQILYGIKYATTRQTRESPFVPNSAFLAQGHTPIGSIEGQSQIRLGYAWGWLLSNGWTFDQAVRFGTDREGSDQYTLWAPSAVLRIPFGRDKRWFTHVEYFGIVSQAKEHDFSKQFIDIGLHYFITPDFEVGTVIACGLNEQSSGILVNVGFGVRF